MDTSPTTSQLEEEGEIAADYLEVLLDIADLDGDIDLDVENDRAAVEVVAGGIAARKLHRLVGDDGEVLDALQELTRLAVQAKSGHRSRLMLDVAGHRRARKETLAEVARVAIAEVESSGSPVTLQAMNPFERKVVHDVIAEAGLISSSQGVEPDRRVVVAPAGKDESAKND